MENPLTSKYKITKTAEGITVKANDNEIFFDASEEKYVIKDCYVTRFSILDDTHGSMSGKHVQYTDINGISSESIVDMDMIEDTHPLKTNDVSLDEDYMFVLFKEKEQSDYVPVYIKIPYQSPNTAI